MADKKEEKKDDKELSSFNVRITENGFFICACYDSKPTLSQRAGWVEGPTCCCTKEYVEKTKASLIKTLTDIVNADCPM